MKQQRRRTCKCCGELYKPDPRNIRHQRYCSKPACKKASKAESQRRWLNKSKNKGYFQGPAHVERVREWRKNHPDYARGTCSPPAEPPSALQDTKSPHAPDIHRENNKFQGSEPCFDGAKEAASGVAASQDAKSSQPVDNTDNNSSLTTPSLTDGALQEDLSPQSIDIQGKSASLSGLALQEVLSSQPLILIGLIANLTGTALQDDIAETARRLLLLGQDILKNYPRFEGEKDADKTSVMPNPPAPDSPTVQLGGPPVGPG